MSFLVAVLETEYEACPPSFMTGPLKSLRSKTPQVTG